MRDWYYPLVFQHSVSMTHKNRWCTYRKWWSWNSSVLVRHPWDQHMGIRQSSYCPIISDGQPSLTLANIDAYPQLEVHARVYMMDGFKGKSRKPWILHCILMVPTKFPFEGLCPCFIPNPEWYIPLNRFINPIQFGMTVPYKKMKPIDNLYIIRWFYTWYRYTYTYTSFDCHSYPNKPLDI